MNGNILAFDVGTSAVKTALFSPVLELMGVHTAEYALSSQGDCVEAAPESYLAAMAQGVRALRPSGIGAIALTTQGETLLPVDGDGNPLCNALVWLDSRARQEAASLKQRIAPRLFYETTGLPEITGALPLCKLMWLKRERPELYARTQTVFLLEDYLRFVLTGTAATHASLATSTGWLELKTGAYWRQGLDAAGISPHLLPPLIPSGAFAGRLLPNAGGLGLPSGVPVYAGAMDQTAAALAALAGREDACLETTGTAHVAAAPLRTPCFSHKHPLTVYRHAIRGQYLALAIGNTGGMALKWFRDTLCPPGASYAELDGMASSVPPGSYGTVFMPYLAGAVDPVSLPEATGCFFGLKLSTPREAMARAVMESVGFELKDFLTLLRDTGCQTRCIRALGGGAKGEVWPAIRADICQSALEAPVLTEAAAAGAALLAAWGAGILPEGAYPPALTQTERVFAPDPMAAPAYGDAYMRYCALRSALTPLYLAGDALPNP